MNARRLVPGLLALSVSLAANAAPLVRDGLLFYASYDRSLDADFAKGKGRVVRSKGKAFVEGKSGKALLCRRKGGVLFCEYAAKDNVLPNCGTIAFHFKPDWSEPDAAGHCFFFRPGKANRGAGCNATDSMTVTARRYRKRDAELWFWRDDHGGGNHLTRTSLEGWRKGEWRHVAVTWDDEFAEIYVDGELKGRHNSGLIVEPDTMFFVGASRNGAFCSEGSLDEFCVYDRVLTLGEIGLLTGRPELLKPRIRSLRLEQNLYYRSEKRVPLRIVLTGLIDPKRLRLSARLIKDGTGQTVSDRKLRALSGRHEAEIEAPEEGAYVLAVRLVDAAGRQLDDKKVTLQVIDGPFDP